MKAEQRILAKREIVEHEKPKKTLSQKSINPLRKVDNGVSIPVKRYLEVNYLKGLINAEDD